MTQIRLKHTLINGRKVTKNNYVQIVAHDERECTNIKGVRAIDEVRAKGGKYYQKWKLKYEDKGDGLKGYIFREVNSNFGINGMHDTPKLAILAALKTGHIQVVLEE